jgi:hypothetical protein
MLPVESIRLVFGLQSAVDLPISSGPAPTEDRRQVNVNEITAAGTRRK